MTDEEQETPINRKEYFREYMRNRYKANPDKARAYKNTLRLKSKKTEIRKEDADKFGIYLADVIKIRQLLQRIPEDFKKELVVYKKRDF